MSSSPVHHHGQHNPGHLESKSDTFSQFILEIKLGYVPDSFIDLSYQHHLYQGACLMVNRTKTEDFFKRRSFSLKFTNFMILSKHDTCDDLISFPIIMGLSFD